MKLKTGKLITLFLLAGIFNYSNLSAQSGSICGVPRISQMSIKKIIENTRLTRPDVYKLMESQKLNKTTKPEDAVGDIKSFYVLNLLKNNFEIVNAKLVKKGNFSQVWVDTFYLNLGWVSNNDINTLFNALENSTPQQSKDPTKGIVKLVQKYFGDPPNKDGDGLTDFLLVQIHDSFDNNAQGPFTAGFFYNYDQTDNKGSNRRDILYIDIFPTIYFSGSHTPLRAAATIAHEFQHLVHYNYDNNEETFVNEGLSLNSEVICGYPLRNPREYFKNTNIPLFNWNTNINGNDVLADYSRAALFTRYYIEQLGDGFIKAIVQDTLNGIKAFNEEFRKAGYRYRFNELFFNFCVANYLNNQKFGPEYYYRYNLNAKPEAFVKTQKTNGSLSRDPIYPYAVDYIELESGGKNLTVELNASSEILSSALLYGRDTSMSVSLLVDRSENFPEFGTNYKKIVFPVANLSENNSKYYFSTTAEDSSVFWTKLNGPETSQLTFDKAVYSITFDTSNAVYAGIADGTLWKSTDDGDTWAKIFTNKYVGYGYSISSLAVDSSNNLYVGTEDKFIFKSTDGGNTFTHLVNYNNDTLWNITKIFYLKSNNTLYAKSGNAAIPHTILMKSTNKGNSWTLVVDTVKMHDLYIDKNEVFYAVGENIISVSKDKGAHWTKYPNVGYQVNNFWGTTIFYSPDNSTIFIGTWNNGLLAFNLLTKKYSYAGIYHHSWQPQLYPYFRLNFTDSKGNFYLLVDDYGIFQSNSGFYWSDFNFNMSKNFTKQRLLCMAENKKGILFVGSVREGVFRSKASIVTKIKEPVRIVNKFRLEQNFPNPFNPSTTIEYSIPRFASSGESPVRHVTLKIYDILGREIFTLVNKNQKSGNYKVEFNANGLPSGVYFYRIKAGEFSEVKKMLLLK